MAYVKERKAFGRALARFEGVSFPIAEAATQLEAAPLALLSRAVAGRPRASPTPRNRRW